MDANEKAGLIEKHETEVNIMISRHDSVVNDFLGQIATLSKNKAQTQALYEEVANKNAELVSLANNLDKENAELKKVIENLEKELSKSAGPIPVKEKKETAKKPGEVAAD